MLRRAKKRKCDNKEETTEERNRRDGIEYEPLFLEGEDEESMKKHKRFIKAEWKKRTPDMKKINERMELTYPDRRRPINAKIPIAKIKEEYPPLFSYDQVLRRLVFLLESEARSRRTNPLENICAHTNVFDRFRPSTRYTT